MSDGTQSLVRHLVASAIILFLCGAVVMGFGGWAGGRSSVRKSTLSHMVAPRFPKVAFLVVIMVFASLLLVADGLATRSDSNWYTWSRLGLTVVALILLFLTICFDVKKYRNIHVALFLAYLLCVVSYGAMDVVRKRQVGDVERAVFQTVITSTICFIILVVGVSHAHYKPVSCIGEFLVLPTVALMVTVAHSGKLLR